MSREKDLRGTLKTENMGIFQKEDNCREYT